MATSAPYTEMSRVKFISVVCVYALSIFLDEVDASPSSYQNQQETNIRQQKDVIPTATTQQVGVSNVS